MVSKNKKQTQTKWNRKMFLGHVSQGASQGVLVVKNPPATAGDMRCGFNPWVGSLLEEGMATHSSIVA